MLLQTCVPIITRDINSNNLKWKRAEKNHNVLVQTLNAYITCSLCGGYFIDATTIVECVHTFCRSCIVSFLEVSEYCPVCDVRVHETKTLQGIRRDKILQDLVYKMVPGLYTREIERRENFYSRNPRHFALDMMDNNSEIGCAEVISEEEKISVSLEFREKSVSNKRKRKTTETVNRRYLLCPAKLTIRLIKKFIRAKFDIDSKYQVEIYHTDEPLEDTYTLVDLAYIYSWQKTAPFKLFFSAFELLPGDENPDPENQTEPVPSCSTPTITSPYRGDDVGQPSEVSESESDSNDKTYTPFTRQNDDDIYKTRRSRGRPYKRRGLSRLMASQRGWDLNILRGQSKRGRRPTGRPRGRPRKTPATQPTRDTFTFMSTSRYRNVKRSRGRPRKQFSPYDFSTPIKKQETKASVKPDSPMRGQDTSSSGDYQPVEIKQEVIELDSDSDDENNDNDKSNDTTGHMSTTNNQPSGSTLNSRSRVSSGNTIRELLLDSDTSPGKSDTSNSGGVGAGLEPRRTAVVTRDCDEKSSQRSKSSYRHFRDVNTKTHRMDVGPVTGINSPSGGPVASINKPSVGRVHWIYRKRKMPTPSIPVSFRLEDTQLTTLATSTSCSGSSHVTSQGYETDMSDMDHCNGGNCDSGGNCHPGGKCYNVSKSTSDGSCYSGGNCYGGGNCSPKKRRVLEIIPENPLHSNVFNQSSSDNLKSLNTHHSVNTPYSSYSFGGQTISTQSANMYVPGVHSCSAYVHGSEPQRTYTTQSYSSSLQSNNISSNSPFQSSTNHPVNIHDSRTGPQNHNANIHDSRTGPQNHNVNMHDSRTGPQNHNVNMQTSSPGKQYATLKTVDVSELQLESAKGIKNLSHLASNSRINKTSVPSDGYNVPGYDSFIKHTSKHRLLYLLKRCTEKPSHVWHEKSLTEQEDIMGGGDDWHESMMISQRRSKEGDSLEEEDSVDEKVEPTSLLEKFQPLNITLN